MGTGMSLHLGSSGFRRYFWRFLRDRIRNINFDIDPLFRHARRLGCGSLGCLCSSPFRLGQLVGALLARRDDHGLFKFVLLGIVRLLVGKTQLVVANRDDVTVLEGMLLDQLAIDVGAVRTVEIFQERVVENIDNQ
jgi:hypothetical protein